MENFEPYPNAYTEDPEYPYAHEWTLTNLLRQIGDIEDENYKKKCELYNKSSVKNQRKVNLDIQIKDRLKTYSKK